MSDMLTLRRVANGFVIAPNSANEQIFVANTPSELASHVLMWAEAQVKPPIPLRED